jgi:hypothetical protein
MNTFDEREKGEELKHARNQEHEFKIASRRNKLLGFWVAEKLGLSGEEAEKYAMSVVIADMQESGDEDVFRKIYADLQNANSDVSEHIVRREMTNLLAVAREEFADRGNG